VAQPCKGLGLPNPDNPRQNSKLVEAAPANPLTAGHRGLCPTSSKLVSPGWTGPKIPRPRPTGSFTSLVHPSSRWAARRRRAGSGSGRWKGLGLWRPYRRCLPPLQGNLLFPPVKSDDMQGPANRHLKRPIVPRGQAPPPPPIPRSQRATGRSPVFKGAWIAGGAFCKVPGVYLCVCTE